MHRGPIYRCDLGHGEKPWPVASNNARDTHLRSALVVRVTTSTKPPLPSIVPIELSGASRAGQELIRSVLCDDIEVLYDDHHVHPGVGYHRTSCDASMLPSRWPWPSRDQAMTPRTPRGAQLKKNFSTSLGFWL